MQIASPSSFAINTTTEIGTLTTNFRPTYVIPGCSPLYTGMITGNGVVSVRNVSGSAQTGAHTMAFVYVLSSSANPS